MEAKQKYHPNRFAVVFKLLPDCPFDGTQYLCTLQSVRHVHRATCYGFWSAPT